MVMSVLIIAFLGSLSGCGDSADPMGTATVQFIDENGAVLFPSVPGNPLVFIVMPGESRQLIVRVTNSRDGGATIVPVVNEQVTFSLLTPGNGGSITMVNNQTDGNGRAVGLYTAGNNFAMDEVRVTTRAGAAAHVTIMKTGGTGYSITVSPTAPTVQTIAGGSSVITANVKNNGTNVNGVTVNFTQTGGVSVLPASATTDGGGNAGTVFSAGAGATKTTAGVVTASITVDGNTYNAFVVVTYP
jgi:hypothetical protein